MPFSVAMLMQAAGIEAAALPVMLIVFVGAVLYAVNRMNRTVDVPQIEGPCPYCSTSIVFNKFEIAGGPQIGAPFRPCLVAAVNCPVCNKRIVVKDLQLYQV